MRLRLTVFSGDPANSVSQQLPEETLSPGGFRQFNSILNSNGLSLSQGYVRVERVSGTAPYFAYAVINDQALQTVPSFLQLARMLCTPNSALNTLLR